MIRIEMPQPVQQILNVLMNAGYEAYAVGGCIRDSILGREPNDWDITTSAKPQEVKALFSHTIDTGIAHGTVTIMIGREGYEVTTYRIDGEYEDSRHPKEVTFTANLLEDLKRRDFTINAMAYNDRTGLVDAFDGMGDMEKGVIRCVGCAKERFTEDALRILRAIRFSAQLGYTIEEQTKEGIRQLAPNLSRISAERIQTELVKLLVSPNPQHLRIAYETGVTKVILPEFDRCMETPQKHKHHCYNVGEHILHSIDQVPAVKALRLSMLLHDMAKPECLTVDEDGTTHFHGHEAKSSELAVTILRRLKFDNDTINTVKKLVLYHDYGKDLIPDRKIVRRMVNRVGEEYFSDLLLVQRADVLAQSDYMREEKLQKQADFRRYFDEIRALGECVSLRSLAVNGSDLMAAGLRPGKALGETLNGLLQHVLEVPSDNEKEILLKLALEMQVPEP